MPTDAPLPPIPGFSLGHAHDDQVKTGATVILPNAPAPASVDVRGGGPGTRETDTLAHGGLIDRVHAIVLSGGSVYGLAAADAVTASLGARGIGYDTGRAGVPKSPIVPAAILFDNANGGDKGWGETPPYLHLGRAALNAADRNFAEGAVGAGYGATAGLYRGGLGIATEQAGDASVTAIIAANPVGSPFLPGTHVPHGWAYARGNEFAVGDVERRPPADYEMGEAQDTKLAFLNAAGQSTVIGAVLTDAGLSPSQLKRLAIMAQDGIALAVQPSHTPLDGDTIFALSLSDEAPEASPAALAVLGQAACRAVARALTRGVVFALGET